MDAFEFFGINDLTFSTDEPTYATAGTHAWGNPNPRPLTIEDLRTAIAKLDAIVGPPPPLPDDRNCNSCGRLLGTLTRHQVLDGSMDQFGGRVIAFLCPRCFDALEDAVAAMSKKA